MRTTTWRWLPLFLAAILLTLAAGCGGDDNGDAGDSGDTTAAETTADTADLGLHRARQAGGRDDAPVRAADVPRRTASPPATTSSC